MATSATATAQRSLAALERWSSALRRLEAFGDDANTALVWEATVELEAAAERVVAEPVHVTEDFMGQCMELLEERLPVNGRASKAVLMLLANLCLTDENRLLASDFGLPGTCVLLLQQHKELSAEALYYVFDLMCTLATSDGGARRNLRPAIPYVLAAVRDHSTALDVLFGAAFLLASLAMLDGANCDLIVQRGGLQVLVDIYRKADQVLRKGASASTKGGRPTSSPYGKAPASGAPVTSTLQSQKQAERLQLCEGAMRWSREALVTVSRGCSAEVECAKQLASLDFGVFGTSVPVDELKWLLLASASKK